ncbi:acyloxyacyl hydrolase [Pseudoduganella sp. DS3]|uniref:Lipid A deacylase n=1 Tax=Pseudoduganella guangdongensis TaxID=2692179 RepID=A0A6N9HAJ9_9BURK|nr:acyloxyacyl hydrolase [Pseudoduganella guangdongensis]MYN00480.1 acyloxyacyl hydrolase [Pseudoduganella guangdongensis]
MHVKKLFATAAALLVAQSAFAFDVNSAYVEYGSASKVRMVRLGATQDFKPEWSWFNSNGTHLTGYWDASVGFWEARQWNNVPGAKKNIIDVGFTPVFRFENTNKKGFYVEGGIGAHVLSRTYNNNDDGLSTAFQFGDHIGVGYVFDKWEVAAKLQHFSNGGIKKPNSGVDYVVLKASYRY